MSEQMFCSLDAAMRATSCLQYLQMACTAQTACLLHCLTYNSSNHGHHML